VVTVMGHVDHGKTSLLDYIRRTNVIAGESGGITQHIGAYEVETPQGRVTFLDTPGHEAFTAMRSRGAQVTDIVVLVVAADDNVMPQTIEAINHARAAQVPIIVAINKIDLPTANPARIKQQLTQYGVILEDFGGQVQSVEISAKFGQGVDTLLERLALETELMELKANPNRPARGVVIEARLDKGRGPVATVLVQNGTLRVGDAFLAGMQAGRVRALLDERGNPIKDAGPSRPVQVLGFDDVPMAGDKFAVYESEREAREIAQYRQQIKREQDYSRIKKVSLTDLKRRISEGELRLLPVIVKGDVDGSVEALSDELARLSNAEVAIQVIHRGVGAISESDVLLASASNAIIIGFHVRPDARARELAAQEQVEIRLYQVIYEAIEEVKASLAGLLDAKITEQVTGTAEIRQVFKVPRVGNVAGCMVRSGVMTRGARVRVMRDGAEAYNGKIGTLRRVKEDVREVPSGYECGISIENFNDIKVGDIIEAYTIIEEARTLESVAG
ncbi:MAG TPA: translation initiation factor IF-2, partial [Candidatus Latescibacteria bacterium]|nr:translation initiation factor IF-2 [Candidatus Latescibacterota bacterium]